MPAVPIATVPTDQRGIARPQGAAPDIGAFESRGFTATAIGGDGQMTWVGMPFAEPLVVTIASPYGEPVAGGRVRFAAPPAGASADLSGSPATISADGRASVTAAANAIAGTFTVTAQTAGAGDAAFILTNRALEPPRVVGLRRLGVHARPTRLVLGFSAPMDPARAGDRANYRLVAPGPDRRLGTADDRPVPIAAASYDAALRSVALAPRRRLPLQGTYRLTVVGTPPGGLTIASGVPLDGAGTGQAGSDFVTTFGREILVRPEATSRAGRLAEVAQRLAERRAESLQQRQDRLAGRQAAL